MDLSMEYSLCHGGLCFDLDLRTDREGSEGDKDVGRRTRVVT